jgi:peptidoglycan L-alanyl-D-glutamate endopeptidase CwlK
MQTVIRQLYATVTPPAVTPDQIQPMFPATPPANIAANLPHVLAALTGTGLIDTAMLLMALATIRAETESFRPIAEAVSRFNTSPGGHPFDLYDRRTDLGNQGPPDGASFRGRGFVQLTGRTNYTRYASELSLDLVNNPALACEPAIAARLLAHFLAARQTAIRHALSEDDLATARRLVNGGTHGLDRFTAAYRTGQAIFLNQELTTDN